MPAVPSPIELLENTLVHRSTNLPSHNATDQVLEVVCAWPVSGQYGPGTRVLYYALMAACVFARKAEWIRSACLAAALLFPAVAALHGIVLAALHQSGAVDMDVYGAFQLCTIGILTAPVTVRLSRTYFNNPGREIIFLWTGLLLAGLLSLTVEFIRLDATPCPSDDPATIEWAATATFSYNSTCGMVCGAGAPSSPLRKSAADNIYVIPVPRVLTFNTATLIAAACCIPAILSVASTWMKILEKNWEKISHKDRPNEKPEEQPIEGTNGATPKQMSGIANRIRGWLTLIEIPVFVAAVMAILIRGEMNFFSKPVYYQTEPIASIGQWAPIVGTGLAVIGSLYLLLAADMEAEENEENEPEMQTDNHLNRGPVRQCERCATCAYPTLDGDQNTIPDSRRSSQSDGEQPSSTEIAKAATEPSVSSAMRRATTNQSEKSIDPGGRRQVARLLNLASKQLAAKAHTHMEDSGFNAQERANFPEIPGESFRNGKLSDFQKAYSNTPLPRSRAASFSHSINSDSSNGEGSSRILQGPLQHLSLPVPPPARTTGLRPHANTLPSRRSSFESTVTPGIGISYRNEPKGPDSPVLPPPSEQQLARNASNASQVSPRTSTSGAQDAAPQIVISSCKGEQSDLG
ncbi:uncharacterized protein N7482_009537 [Penicillium canariense]|uniref:Uncharacterized protein n=1 Tax=Penicillium canariense TaxID=189055 RepID=A0A9W9HTE9_9EURO|nr:uncharacterized protein N7482_009537 [Penicillium canariense]KAJ5153059.1 hypothetical protein N7482_009537 [Penicillium canariense]